MAKLPEIVWAPAAVMILTAIIGGAGLLAGVPWLFPSLGPTLFLQVHRPDLETARLYNVLAGHACGIAAAVVALLVTGAGDVPSVLATNSAQPSRVAAAVLAMGATLLLQVPLRASHPPAAATALLVALGGFALAWHDMAILAAGIVLAGVLGECARRLRGGSR